MVVLRHVERDSIRRRRHNRVGIAHGHVRDAQRDRQVAVEQQRRSIQQLRDVVEAEVPAVARQKICDVRLDAEQITNRVRVLRAIQSVHLRAARVRVRRGVGVERSRQRVDELRASFLLGLRLLARRHRADLELVQHLFPRGGICVHVVRHAPVERQVGREIRVVMAVRAIACEHAPLLAERRFRFAVMRGKEDAQARGDDTNSGDVDPSSHRDRPSAALAWTLPCMSSRSTDATSVG